MTMQDVWTHLDCATAATARKFNLNDDDREELYSRVKCKLIVAAHTAQIDDTKASAETYLSRVIDNELADWRAERFATSSEAMVWRDRHILYSPSRYGSVAKMIRMIDFHLACESLTDAARSLLEKHLYESLSILEAGAKLGFGQYRSRVLFNFIKTTIRKYYHA